MKKFFVAIGLSCLAFLCGCFSEFNPATGREETLMYGDEKEKNIGAAASVQVEKTVKLNTDVDVNERAEKILKRIVAVCDRKDLVYTVRVIEDDAVNAFSLPGGYVYVNKGLVDLVTNDDQLVAVIAHEVAHITAKHAMKRLQGAYGALVLQGAAIASGQGGMAAGVGIAADSLLFANSREDEFEADRLGVRYMKRAGYDPSQMRVMLGKLLEHQMKEPPRPFTYWRTHPFIPQRMARANEAAKGAAGFRDYLNITGEEK
ncbi:MAG: M48 family metalloprotease [Candidatus Omnitrophica bacterium]|nr:M48 family metalloprotease [Candidatus Omnitrophota bacterium]